MTEPTDVERELTPEEQAAEIERLAEIDRRLEEQPDGSIKVTLRDPVPTENGGERVTLVVRPATAGDIRRGRKAIFAGEEPNFAFADELVDPKKVYEGIRRNDDLELVKEAVDRSVGKFLGNGSSSSSE